MLPRNDPDRIQIAFDDHRLVNNAGLLLPTTLALRLGLGELVDQHVDLGDAPGRANTGDKMMTLVASALAGGDCESAVAQAGQLAVGCIMEFYAQFHEQYSEYHGSYTWQKLVNAVGQCGLQMEGSAHRALADTQASLAALNYMASLATCD